MMLEPAQECNTEPCAWLACMGQVLPDRLLLERSPMTMMRGCASPAAVSTALKGCFTCTSTLDEPTWLHGRQLRHT